MAVAISARILENGKRGSLRGSGRSFRRSRRSFRRSRRGFRGLGSRRSLGGAWFV